MTDVARLAGVSHQTVSRVLNGHRSVSATTRARVLAAIDQLGYRPNAAARMLVTGRSRTLGVVTVATGLYGPSSTLQAIQHAAEDAGYYVSVGSLRVIDRHSLQDLVNRLVDHGVDGVVVIAPHAVAASALAGLRVDVPIVAAEGEVGGGIPTVTIDQLGGARLATEHLVGLGHRTVWHVAGPVDWVESAQRISGWRSVLEQHGLEVPPPFAGDWTAASGYDVGRALGRMPDVSAVFVANDQMALGVLRALHECGRRVPEDVSVVGFDDIPEAAYFSPPLTTVRQDFPELGRRSVDVLVSLLDPERTAPASRVVAPALVQRQSSILREQVQS